MSTNESHDTGETPAASVNGDVSIPAVSVSKVALMLRAVGDAPPIQKNKFQLAGNKPVSFIQGYLRKTLQTDKGIYLFCASSFCPNPDQTVQELFDAFQIGGELTICYSFQETWG